MMELQTSAGHDWGIFADSGPGRPVPSFPQMEFATCQAPQVELRMRRLKFETSRPDAEVSTA